MQPQPACFFFFSDCTRLFIHVALLHISKLYGGTTRAHTFEGVHLTSAQSESLLLDTTNLTLLLTRYVNKKHVVNYI